MHSNIAYFIMIDRKHYELQPASIRPTDGIFDERKLVFIEKQINSWNDYDEASVILNPPFCTETEYIIRLESFHMRFIQPLIKKSEQHILHYGII